MAGHYLKKTINEKKIKHIKLYYRGSINLKFNQLWMQKQFQ